MNDPLNRPIAEHLITEKTVAGDLILANLQQRFVAFCIDATIIAIISGGGIFALQHHYGKISSAIFCLIIYISWGGYVVLFSTINNSATIGQKLMRIQLYSLFSSGINFSTAFIRFILISYPVAIALVFAGDLICSAIAPNLVLANASNHDESNMGYTLLVVATLLQIWLLMPLISGKYRNVSWDKTLRCCIIKQRL